MSKSGRGFTLIEVVAAMVVLALLVVPLLGAKNRTVASAVRTSKRSAATQLAASKISELAAVPLEEIDRYGSFDGAPGRTWAFVVEAVDPEVTPELYRVTLTVSYLSPSVRGDRAEIVVSTLVFSGEQEGGGDERTL